MRLTAPMRGYSYIINTGAVEIEGNEKRLPFFTRTRTYIPSGSHASHPEHQSGIYESRFSKTAMREAIVQIAPS